MSSLTPEELTQLSGLDFVATRMNPDQIAAHRNAARTFTDALRQALPDIDDVTLGRVVLQFGCYTNAICGGPTMHTLTSTMLVAALDLTALERGAMPDGPNT